jgi:hypothetical protein
MSRYLIEDTVKLRLSHFPKKLLTIQKAGEFVLVFGLKLVTVKYSQVREICNRKFIDIEYSLIKDKVRRQTIELGSKEIYFGNRPFLICPECGHFGNQFYIKGGDRFLCRDCIHATYQLTTFNKNTVAGIMFYFNAKILKLQEKIITKRVQYRGEKTKRVLRAEASLNKWLENKNTQRMIAMVKQNGFLL